MNSRVLIAILILAFSPCASAAWREAGSEHFVVIANTDEKTILLFAEKLERFHDAMARMFPAASVDPSPSNRVTIYAVGDLATMQSLYGSKKKNSQFIGGFYIPRAGGSVAYVEKVNSTWRADATESERILLHEYAHHFQHESLPYMVPMWFVEGFAEYFSYARFDSDGAVDFGLPTAERRVELFNSSRIAANDLLDSRRSRVLLSDPYSAFHGKSWLLFHYLSSIPDGLARLKDYLARLNAGQGELDSARAAFGDLQELDSELGKYQKQRRFQYFHVSAAHLNPGKIVVRSLNEAEVAILPVRFRSDRGVNREEAAAVVNEARKVVARYPQEPEVLAALAEAEYDAGNDREAIAAADKVLAIKPQHMNALLQKGYALTRIAMQSTDPSAFLTPRRHFLAVNQIEPDNPVPLVYIYLSYQRDNAFPAGVVRGLERALELAPFDNALRALVAERQLQDRRLADAIRTLGPLAYNPHLAGNNPALDALENARKELAALEEGGAGLSITAR